MYINEHAGGVGFQRKGDPFFLHTRGKESKVGGGCEGAD